MSDRNVALHRLGVALVGLMLSAGVAHASAVPECRIAPGDPIPSETGFVDTPGFADGIAVAGSLAFVADVHSGLRVIDVSDPAAPVEIGSLDTPGSASGLAVAGSLAFVADGPEGLRVIDVSTPTAPVEVGSLATQEWAGSVAISGSLAFVADGFEGLRVIDVSDPTAPVEIGSIATPDNAWDVAVAGSLAFVADETSGLRVIDVSDPTAPVEIGFLDTPSDAFGIAVSGSLVFIADGDSGLRVIDVSTPTTPAEVGFLDTPGVAWGLAVSGSLAFVADGSAGHLRVIDVSNPAAPVEVAFIDTPGDTDDVAVVGSRVFVADWEAGLRVVSLNPGEAGNLDTVGTAKGVAASGPLAFLAAGFSGLRVIDVSTPAAPVEVGSVDLGDAAIGVTVEGSLAFVAANFSGLRVVDVSTPATPVEVGSVDTPGVAWAVAVEGSLALVADGTSGLRVIDVSTPASPVEVGFLDTPGSARGVAVEGSLALVADGTSGLRVIDVSTPAAPVELSSLSTPTFASAVALEGSLALVGANASGVRMIDVSTPASPVEVGFHDTPRIASGVAVARPLILVADESRLRITYLPCPSPVARFAFDETGNAPGNQGGSRRPLRTRDDAGTALDLHSADDEGPSGLPGDRAYASTGPSDHGSAASAGSDGFRADQPDDDALDGLVAFTISGWLRTETTASLLSKSPRLVSNHDGESGASGDGFELRFASGSDGDLELIVDDDSGGGAGTGGTPYADKQKWVFFAVSYDGDRTTDNVRFYRGYRHDGEAGGGAGSASVALVGTASLDRGPVDDEAVGLHLGNRPGADRPFDGWLDEIRVDPFALAPDDARRLLEGYRLDALRARGVWRLELADSDTVATSALDQTATTVSVKGLSGVTYDPVADRFWAVADGGGRLLGIDASFHTDGQFESVAASSALTLVDSLDFESIAFTSPARNSVYLADEGNTAIGDYDLGDGSFVLGVAVPGLFTSNVRPSRGFEALGLRPDGAKLLVGVEHALTVDGPGGTATTTSTVSRWQQFSVSGGVAIAEEQVAYAVEPVHGSAPGSTGSGLHDLLLLPNGLVLSLERSDADGELLTRIYATQLAGATDVSQGAAGSGLDGERFTPGSKRLLFSDDSLGEVDGLALGPSLSGPGLADAGYAILAVEDGDAVNVVHAFRLRTVPEPAGALQLAVGALTLGALAAGRARPRCGA